METFKMISQVILLLPKISPDDYQIWIQIIWRKKYTLFQWQFSRDYINEDAMQEMYLKERFISF